MNETQNTPNIQTAQSNTNSPQFPLIGDTLNSVFRYLKDNKARLIEIVKPWFTSQIITAICMIAAFSVFFFKAKSLGMFAGGAEKLFKGLFDGSIPLDPAIPIAITVIGVIFVVGIIANIIFYMGAKINLFEEFSGRKGTWKDNLKRFFVQFFSLVWIGIICMIASGAGEIFKLIPLLGSIIAIAFSVWVSISVMFSIYNFLDNSQVKGIASVTKSFSLVKDYWWKIFLSVLVMGLIGVAIYVVFILVAVAIVVAGLYIGGITTAYVLACIALLLFIVLMTVLTVYVERWRYEIFRNIISIKSTAEFTNEIAITSNSKFEKTMRAWVIAFMVIWILYIVIMMFVVFVMISSGPGRTALNGINKNMSSLQDNSLIEGKGTMTLEKIKEVIAKGDIKESDMIVDKFDEKNGWPFSVSSPKNWDWQFNEGKRGESPAITYFSNAPSERELEIVFAKEQITNEITARFGTDVNSVSTQNAIFKTDISHLLLSNRKNLEVSRISDKIILSTYDISVPDRAVPIHGEFFVIFDGSEIHYAIVSASSDIWNSVAPRVYSMVLSYTPDHSATKTGPNTKPALNSNPAK